MADRPWPPPDPERMPRKDVSSSKSSTFLDSYDTLTASERIAAFRERQRVDQQRFVNGPAPEDLRNLGRVPNGPAWRDSEGERLDDFGVDESVEIDDEDTPLSEIVRERKRSSQKL